jgi:predicted nucleotidyltransferase
MTQFALSHASLTRAISRRAAACLRAFRADVERALPGQVERVVLFGSRATRCAKPASDYDVAILLRHDAAPPARLGHVLSDLAYPHVRAGVPIRAIALTGSAVDTRSPMQVARDIARDGIEIV